MEEQADNIEEMLKDNKKNNCKIYLIIHIILALLILGAIVTIICIAFTKKEQKIEVIIKPEYNVEGINWDYFGEITKNISYAKDDKIENSFREGGKNYVPEIGNINNGKNYAKNERNVYDLYVPYSAFLNKDKYNGIILFVHGGSWIEGTKESFDLFCKIYGEMGYITATIGYTVLHGIYPNNNIFRIMDEISFCIDSIKEELKTRGFNETNLELALGGYSAGGHLILLYTYLMENSSIPIKFAINICGPISVEPKHFMKLAKVNDTLEGLELSYIEPAIENKRIIRTSNEDTILLQYMNAFIGERYKSQELEEILNDNKTINYSNEKFKALYNSVKYSFPVSIKDKNNIPTLCLYSGNDDIVGVVAYAYLKDKADKDNKHIDLIYSKYADHNFMNFNMTNSIESLRKLNVKIIEYAKTYFTKE